MRKHSIDDSLRQQSQETFHRKIVRFLLKSYGEFRLSLWFFTFFGLNLSDIYLEL